MFPLILACCRVDADAGEIRRLAGACTDWDRLTESALQHKVAPLVFQALARDCPELVPAGALAALRQRFLFGTKRSLLYAEELFRLLELFGRAGIEAIPFKGPTLAWSGLYEKPGLRSMSDLDVLVPQRDIGRAIDLLTANGYRRWGPNIGLRFFADGGQVLLHHAGAGFAVDLHWRVVAAHCNPLDAAEIRARAASVAIDGRTAPTFCPEDLLAYLCVHGAKHGWDTLAGVCDVDRLIRVHKLDWDAILARAARQRMSRMLCLGLCLAQDLLGTNLPAEAAGAIRGNAESAALAASIGARLREGRAWSSRDVLTLRLQLREGIWNKWLFFWYLLQPCPADWETLHLPKFLFPVYYFARPFQLAWKWCVRPIFT